MSEMAIVSSRKARLQQRAEEGEAGALAAFALANDPGQFLSAIQVGITSITIAPRAAQPRTDCRHRGASHAVVREGGISPRSAPEPLERPRSPLDRRPACERAVCKGGLDNILGILQLKDLLKKIALPGQPFDVLSPLQTPVYVPDTLSPMRLLEMFKKTGRPMSRAVRPLTIASRTAPSVGRLRGVTMFIAASITRERPSLALIADSSGLTRVATSKDALMAMCRSPRRLEGGCLLENRVISRR